MDQWFTGSGKEVKFDDIIYQIKEHSFANGMVYVGTDSFFKKMDCIFSTAICLYGADNQSGGRYFFKKTKFSKKKFPVLSLRMLKEAENTINMAKEIVDRCSWTNIDLHLDISSSDKDEGTSHLANMLIGYVKGSGFNCKVKPDAFAAASLADKHSK